MTLSEEARAELVRSTRRQSCCRLAELSGLARGAGTFHLRAGGEIGVHLDLADPAVARRAFSLLKSFGAAAELRMYQRQAFGRENRVQLHVGDSPRAVQTLEEAGIIDTHLAPMPFPPARITRTPCCRASYLRGVFLSAGSASAPGSTHLELRVTSEAAAEHLAQLAAAENVPLATLDRTRYAIAYTKSAEILADFLALVGASETALILGESAVVATARSDANRRANADHANLVRTSVAAHEQLAAIHRLEVTGQLADLSEDLAQAARLRSDHPFSSLSELATIADPPATRVALHRRLRKLRELAEG